MAVRFGISAAGRDAGVRLRREAARRLQSAAELPHAARKLMSVLTLFAVTAFSLTGGVLLFAAAMHAVVVRLDMPPALPYSVYAAEWRAFARAHPGAAKTRGAGGQAVEPLIAVPRPTVSRALNSALERAGNPADPYIQSDAVGMGLFLQREVHRLLLRLFGAATRSRAVGPPPPVVPLTNGQ